MRGVRFLYLRKTIYVSKRPHQLFESFDSTDICTPSLSLLPSPHTQTHTHTNTHTYAHRAKSALEVKFVVFRRYKIAQKTLSLNHFISDIISLRLVEHNTTPFGYFFQSFKFIAMSLS